MSNEQAPSPRELAVIEATAWIAAGNGSSRLQKIAQAGLLGSSLTVYREERLQAELPALAATGWTFTNREIRDLVNPSEAHVEELLAARRLCIAAPNSPTCFCGVTLGWWNEQKTPVLFFHWLGAKLVKPLHRRVDISAASFLLKSRIARALAWPESDVESMSLASLRDLVRPVDAVLAEEISHVIQQGAYVGIGRGWARLIK